MPIACIYTMNVSDEVSHMMGYNTQFEKYESSLENLFIKPEHLYSMKHISLVIILAMLVMFLMKKKENIFIKHNFLKI